MMIMDQPCRWPYPEGQRPQGSSILRLFLYTGQHVGGVWRIVRVLGRPMLTTGGGNSRLYNKMYHNMNTDTN